MQDNCDIPQSYLSREGAVAHELERRVFARLDQLKIELVGLVRPINESLVRLEKKMADVNEVIEAFRAAVEKEFLDDKAQNDLIEILKGKVNDADALVQAARDGEANAKADVDRLLAEMQAQTARLGENDIPEDVEPPVEPTPEPTPEPAPEVPDEAPVTEPAPTEPAPVVEPPVEEPVAEEPVAEEPVAEEPVAGPDVPQEGEPVNPPVDVPVDEAPDGGEAGTSESAPAEGEPAPTEPAPGEAETVDNPDEATGTPPNPFAI